MHFDSRRQKIRRLLPTNDIAIAVRAGGHSLAGDSFCDGGVLIDVSGIKAINLDLNQRLARVDAGLTAAELDRATQAFGMATVLGECSAVGIAGYTLGGGLGRLMGQHGAASDNLLSAEVVMAGGGIVLASADENGDLFWAIRGGGGTFGIVTSLEYQLHPVGNILGGSLTYPISAIREVLTFLDGFMMTAPDEFDVVVDIGNGGLMTFAPRVIEPILNLAVSYCGDLGAGETALKPLRSFCRPLADTIRAMTYLEIQALSDIRPLAEFGSAGGSMVLEGGFIERFGTEVIDTLLEYLTDTPPCFWFTAEHYLHGAVCRPAPDATAFGLRRPGYSSRIFAAWRDSSQTEVSALWVKRLSSALEPFSGGVSYVNYLTGSTGETGVRAAYGANYERLVALKNKYDPSNFFNSNRNIKPDDVG